MKKLYLDIDEVLLTRRGEPANGLVDFLKFATENFDCYWLTTHCDGDTKDVFLYLVGKIPAEAIPFIEKIKPTKFGTFKTEAIDFESGFFFFFSKKNSVSFIWPFNPSPFGNDNFLTIRKRVQWFRTFGRNVYFTHF